MGENPETKFVRQSADGELYDSFVKALTEPVAEIEFFDCLGWESSLLEHRNFEPKKIMKLLVEQAASQDISPEEFHKDMRRLICLLNQQTSSSCWQKEVMQLEMKYSVKSHDPKNDPNLITRSRLYFMFPHYYFISLTNEYKIGDIISSMFGRPEFGGLIPIDQHYIYVGMKKVILTIHIYCLHHHYGNSLRLCQLLLKKRIQTGLLSDERRVRFLEAKGVITANGKISATTREALDYVKKQAPNIENEILWHLYGIYN